MSRHEEKSEGRQRAGRRQADPLEEQRVPRRLDASLPHAHPEDEQGTALRHQAEAQEPYFPSAEEAVDANKEAYARWAELFGDSPEWGGVLKPNELQSALDAAKNHYYYGPEEDEGERLAQAAGKMAWRVAGNQVFANGNKRTAFWTAREMLDRNGLGHLSPLDHDDTEFADHLIGQDRYGADRTMAPEQLTAERERLENEFLGMWRQRYDQGQPNPQYVQQYPEGTYISNPEEAAQNPPDARQSNILDPVHGGLDPAVWDNPADPEPHLRSEHRDWIINTIYDVFERHGYDGMENWLSFVLTGSLTTYQYSDESDCDVSLFVDAKTFPEWSRAEMIGIMVSEMDGTKLPGTTHTMQGFVVDSKRFSKEDLYKVGLRSGYDLELDQWIVPPDRGRVHDVEREMNEAYTVALENADKMERLLRYEPQKAILFWHQIHKRRMRDQQRGKGDYAPSNITYKMLNNRGLFPKISDVSGEYIASSKKP